MILKELFIYTKQGAQGYCPDKDDCSVNSIKGKTFSGYHIIAYYYISWLLATPEWVPQLNLPYKAEYKIALKIKNLVSNEGKQRNNSSTFAIQK